MMRIKTCPTSRRQFIAAGIGMIPRILYDINPYLHTTSTNEVKQLWHYWLKRRSRAAEEGERYHRNVYVSRVSSGSQKAQRAAARARRLE